MVIGKTFNIIKNKLNMKKKLVKVSNYAHETGLSTVHVYRLIKQGKVKSENIDGVIFVVKED